MTDFNLMTVILVLIAFSLGMIHTFCVAVYFISLVCGKGLVCQLVSVCFYHQENCFCAISDKFLLKTSKEMGLAMEGQIL